MERHHPWWHRETCSRKIRIKTAGRMPAILKYNFLYNGLNRLRRDFRTIEQMNIRITNIEVQQFKEKKEQGEGIHNLVGVHSVTTLARATVSRAA
jgi:hypothetical protein